MTLLPPSDIAVLEVFCRDKALLSESEHKLRSTASLHGHALDGDFRHRDYDHGVLISVKTKKIGRV